MAKVQEIEIHSHFLFPELEEYSGMDPSHKEVPVSCVYINPMHTGIAFSHNTLCVQLTETSQCSEIKFVVIPSFILMISITSWKSVHGLFVSLCWKTYMEGSGEINTIVLKKKVEWKPTGFIVDVFRGMEKREELSCFPILDSIVWEASASQIPATQGVRSEVGRFMLIFKF